jgi:hypothetical protein
MNREKKIHPALKHGGYAALGLLPGERETDFDKLQTAVIEDLAPVGPLEEDIVLTIARLLWRKHHLATFDLVRTVESKFRSIKARLGQEAGLKPPGSTFPSLSIETYENEEHEEAWEEVSQRAWNQTRKELGAAFVDERDKASIEGLMKELEVAERIDASIEKCIKRLLLLRGVKSLAQPTALAASSSPKRLTSRRVGVGDGRHVS